MTDKQNDFLCLAILTAGFASYHWVAGILAFIAFVLLIGAARNSNKKPDGGGDSAPDDC